jgi:rfaE bifunctional protein nucleotidyltransferase chain/domain
MTAWQKYSSQKRIAPSILPSLVKSLRDDKKTIATLNGSFDLLHAGHLHILYEASEQADILIVALNSDASIQTYKSADRPIIPLKYRIEMLSALGFVDYVTWFQETTPLALLDTIAPDVHVNGVEYGNNCIEKEIVERNGGRLHIVDLIPGLSTSAIVDKIGQLCV